jgi:uncharacterized protein
MAKPPSIWIDLDNSPHVPLFLPVIRHYREKGVEVIVTARDHSQTIELLELAGLGGTFTVIGKHAGKGKLAKIAGTLRRALELASFIRRTGERPAVAVSHGSRSMVIAAKLLRVPVVTMYDYEFTETKIFNRLSDVVIVPDAIPDATLDEIALAPRKRRKYRGIKEELYVKYFQPEEGFRSKLLGHDHEGALVVLRPPATTANYHDEQSENILTALLEHLAKGTDIEVVISPRTRQQGDWIRSKGYGFRILEGAVDGLNLVNSSDLVISGGGTMNREAVLLAVPVYSFFAGRQGALDQRMEADGKITFIRSSADLAKIKLRPRERAVLTPLTDRVERFVIEQIDAFL